MRRRGRVQPPPQPMRIFVFLYYRRVVQNLEQFISTSCRKGNLGGYVGDRTFLPLSPSLVLGNEREAPLIFESGYRAGAIWPRARGYTYKMEWVERVRGVRYTILQRKMRTLEHSIYVPMQIKITRNKLHQCGNWRTELFLSELLICVQF